MGLPGSGLGRGKLRTPAKVKRMGEGKCYSQSKYSCPNCKSAGEIEYRRPPIVGVTIIHWKCDNCWSEFMLRITKKRGVDNSQVVINYKLKARRDNHLPKNISNPYDRMGS